LTKEDKETNSTTSQIEEKTFTATTMTTGHRQEQRVVTQEVRTATILTSAEPTQVRMYKFCFTVDFVFVNRPFFSSVREVT
jgi:hypothetical protein